MLAVLSAAGNVTVEPTARAVPFLVSLQAILATPWASIFTLDTVIFSLLSWYGTTIAALAARMLRHVGVGDVGRLRDQVAERARDQRHLAVDRDRLRHFDAAEIERHHQRQQHRELDRRDAALVAQQPPYRPARAREQTRSRLHGALSLVGLVAERRGRDDQALAARHVGEVEAEQRHVDRPFVHQAHHDDVARARPAV